MFSRRREHKCSTSRTLVSSWTIKGFNGPGLKIAVMKIYRTVASAYTNRIIKKYNEQAVIVIVIVGNSGT